MINIDYAFFNKWCILVPGISICFYLLPLVTASLISSRVDLMFIDFIQRILGSGSVLELKGSFRVLQRDVML
jgi:hypothetical protein